MSETVTVIKLNVERNETWRYPGEVLRRWPNAILLEARFNREDTPFHDILLGRGDRFVEIYYTDRWYNINEIHDREDNHLKGWYCNVTYPAELKDGKVYYIDLALDLLVYPDGRQLVLDEDEFAALKLDETTARQAWTALEDLRSLFAAPGGFHLEPVDPS
jgi:predicted RNA-binding protein associated with RNAse of E/G family